MRRSFGPGMGGGGGGGGGGMIKTVHRAVRAGIGGGATPESYNSHTATTTRTTSNNRNQPINTTTTLSLSSSNNTNPASPCSYLNHPVPATNWGFTTSPVAGEEFDWEYVDGGAGDSDGDSVNGFYDDLVFGNVPSQQEVHHAVSSLQEVLEPVSFAQLIKNRETAYSSDDNGVEKILSPTSFHKPGSELDWIEPSLQLYNTLQVPSSDKVYDAFHLLQTEPSVQRMVISLSSDKAVWDAVMNNEVVRELRESVIEDKSISDGPKDDDSNPVSRVLRWMFMNTKDRVIEIVEKITKMVNELVLPMNNNKKKYVNHVGLGLFEEKLRSSFFLSIMVLLIVVVSRSRKC